MAPPPPPYVPCNTFASASPIPAGGAPHPNLDYAETKCFITAACRNDTLAADLSFYNKKPRPIQQNLATNAVGAPTVKAGAPMDASIIRIPTRTRPDKTGPHRRYGTSVMSSIYTTPLDPAPSTPMVSELTPLRFPPTAARSIVQGSQAALAMSPASPG